MRLDASDIKELNLLKYYRLIRKWACKTYDLKDADLEKFRDLCELYEGQATEFKEIPYCGFVGMLEVANFWLKEQLM